MTERDRTHEQLDRLVESIRTDRLDDATVAEATERVWSRIAAGLEHPIHGCSDYQRLIPDLVAGRLPAARALLVEDHTRECVICRRTLLEARSGRPTAAVEQPSARAGRTIPRWARLAAAAVVVVGLGLVGGRVVGDLVVDRQLTATVEAADGAVQRVGRASTEPLANGTEVGSRQLLRTSSNASAQIRLADGSLVEIAPRSEIELRGAMRGTTLQLRRGNIIVEAAKQHGGRLFVATDDCLVAVRGTVFAVDHGLKGSRVSVLEGEVEVRRNGRSDFLAPGEQVTTRDRLEAVSIEQQIAWSPKAEEHLALLRELSRLRREVVDAIEPRTPRTSSRLLAMVPTDTVIYIAVPNLTEGLHEARTIVEQRIAASPVLSSWWREHVVANGFDRELDAMLDRLQPLGEAVGDEVVITVPESGLEAGGGPVILALLDDPASFATLLREQVERANATAGQQVIDLVEHPDQAPPSPAELQMTIDGDLFVAAAGRPQLIAAVDRGHATETFTDRELGRRLTEAYRQGVSWVVGVDLHALMARAAASSGDEGAVMMERLGLLDATTLVVSSSRDGDRRTLDAAIDFEGSRRGAAAWLADPAPMGSLEFVSPGASFAVAGVAKDAAVILDELLAAVADADPDATNDFAELETALGIDLRADLAAPLGNEAAFAVDGPVLPVPSWKLIVEVYDPATLMFTLERAVTELNRHLAEHGRPLIELDETEVGGRSYRILTHPSSSVDLALLAFDGYLIVAPSTAIVEQALQYRNSGVTLPSSATFQELMPRDGYTDCSALVWRNLDAVLDSVPASALGQLPPEALAMIEDGGGPALICAYGTDGRIEAKGTGDSLLGSAPILGLGGLLHAAPKPPSHAADPVSSAG